MKKMKRGAVRLLGAIVLTLAGSPAYADYVEVECAQNYSVNCKPNNVVSFCGWNVTNGGQTITNVKSCQVRNGGGACDCMVI